MTTVSVEAETVEQAKEEAMNLAPSSTYDVQSDPIYNIDYIDELIPSTINDTEKHEKGTVICSEHV